MVQFLCNMCSCEFVVLEDTCLHPMLGRVHIVVRGVATRPKRNR